MNRGKWNGIDCYQVHTHISLPLIYEIFDEAHLTLIDAINQKHLIKYCTVAYERRRCHCEILSGFSFLMRRFFTLMLYRFFLTLSLCVCVFLPILGSHHFFFLFICLPLVWRSTRNDLWSKICFQLKRIYSTV